MKSQGFFINNILNEEPSFEVMTNYLKTFSKFIKEDKNISLKNKCLIGGWILMTLKIGYITCANKKVITEIFLS